MTRAEWILRYRAAWALRRPDLPASYFTEAFLDAAYTDLAREYPTDPERAAHDLADLWEAQGSGRRSPVSCLECGE